MNISAIIKEAHETAKEKGWYDRPVPTEPQELARYALVNHALIVSEVAEAMEEARGVQAPLYQTADGKLHGELIELADAVIRIADYCGARGWDLETALRKKMDFNKTRPHRHGGKKV